MTNTHEHNWPTTKNKDTAHNKQRMDTTYDHNPSKVCMYGHNHMW